MTSVGKYVSFAKRARPLEASLTQKKSLEVKGHHMTDIELEKIKAHIRTYLAVELCGDDSPWFKHHIRLNLQLFEWAQTKNQNLSLDEFLEDVRKPQKPLKQKR